jgi:hypothetical protein
MQPPSDLGLDLVVESTSYPTPCILPTTSALDKRTNLQVCHQARQSATHLDLNSQPEDTQQAGSGFRYADPDERIFLDAGMQETRVVDAGWRRVDTIYSEGQQSEGEQTESRRSLQQSSGCLLNSRHEYFSARLLCGGEEMYRRWTGHEQIQSTAKTRRVLSSRHGNHKS